MTVHKSVLLKETIENLKLKKGAIVVDATLGGGGHSEAILSELGDEGKLVAIDLDLNAIERFKSKIKNQNAKLEGRISLMNSNFAELENILKEIGIDKVDAIMADLGWSSDQIENPEFGMSFQKEGPLDMRYDKNQELTAQKIINEYSQDDLEKILKEYGEEKLTRIIVKKIIEARNNKAIETTTELAEIIKNALPEKFRHGKIHPATKTFQALRIKVNHELDSLKKFLPQAIDSLKPGGRLAVITFHSLEDRIVKNIFRENAGGCICPPAMLIERAQQEFLSAKDEVSIFNVELPVHVFELAGREVWHHQRTVFFGMVLASFFHLLFRICFMPDIELLFGGIYECGLQNIYKRAVVDSVKSQSQGQYYNRKRH
jgi:16S rRNA (cytosine1402-N4)-methyltransferase